MVRMPIYQEDVAALIEAGRLSKEEAASRPEIVEALAVLLDDWENGRL